MSNHGAHLVAVLSHPEEVRTMFPWAASLARQWELPLTLLHIIDPVSTFEVQENAEAMARDMLGLLARAPSVDGTDITVAVESGDPGAVLADFGKRSSGAVFVLAGGDHGRFARALLGRGHDNVIHKIASPFVFLPSKCGQPEEIRLAVAGVDGSDIAERALSVGRQLLGRTPVLEVEVLEPGTLPSAEYLAFEPEFSETHIRMRGRAEIALLATARARNAGLIFVGRHGTSGLFGQHLGGTAEWLSHHSDRPVLIVPRAQEVRTAHTKTRLPQHGGGRVSFIWTWAAAAAPALTLGFRCD